MLLARLLMVFKHKKIGKFTFNRTDSACIRIIISFELCNVGNMFLFVHIWMRYTFYLYNLKKKLLFIFKSKSKIYPCYQLREGRVAAPPRKIITKNPSDYNR